MIYNESPHAGHFNFRVVDADAADVFNPCPFCGGRDIELANTHTAHYWVECKGCEAQVPDPKSPRSKSQYAHRQSAHRAIFAWNRRVPA